VCSSDLSLYGSLPDEEKDITDRAGNPTGADRKQPVGIPNL